MVAPGLDKHLFSRDNRSRMKNRSIRNPLAVAACLAVVLLACWGARPVVAGTPNGFQAAVEAAYPNYRMAWFYTRTLNPTMAGMELGEFRRAWKSIVARYRAAPPETYRKDPRWAASLDRVGEISAQAAMRIEAGGGREIGKLLEGIRDELGELRRRNGIEVFSDRVNAFGREVATLSDLRRRTVSLTPEILSAYRASAARLTELMKRIRAGAPSHLASDSGFKASIDGNFKSIAKLDRGLARNHLRAVKGSVSSIRADYVLLFIRYG